MNEYNLAHNGELNEEKAYQDEQAIIPNINDIDGEHEVDLNEEQTTTDHKDETEKRSAYLRFGKRSYLRFGRNPNLGFLRFGKRSPSSFLRFGKRSPAYLRFGKKSVE